MTFKSLLNNKLSISLLLILLLSFNILISVLHYAKVHSGPYDNISNDSPIEAPITSLDSVAMTLFETTRFQLNSSDTISNKEWKSIYSGPYTMHLGLEQRVFLIALYHQTHCLRALEYIFVYPESTVYSEGHIQHCINYLRQHFLCQADDELEMGDFLEWDMQEGRVHSPTKVCRDWEHVHDAAGKNLEMFHKMKKEKGS